MKKALTRFDPTPEEYHIVETWQPGAGKLVKRWRESRHMSQATLARKVACDGSLITYWEQEKKAPSGQRREMLLAVIAPRNLVRVSEDGSNTGQDLDLLVRRLENQYETLEEQWYYLLKPNISKILICLIQKSTGNIMPGVDVKAATVVLEWFKDVRREYELLRQKSGEKNISSAGAQWLRNSLSGDIRKTGYRDGVAPPDSSD
jgi:DNA-binding transcriptional regulator YiaG